MSVARGRAHSLVFQGVQRHTEREYRMAQDRLSNNNKNPNHNLTKFPSVTRNGVQISPVRERPGKDPYTSSVRISFYHKGGLRTFAAGASHPSRGVGSRHSGHPKLGLALRCRKSASGPSAFVAHAIWPPYPAKRNWISRQPIEC